MVGFGIIGLITRLSSSCCSRLFLPRGSRTSVRAPGPSVTRDCDLFSVGLLSFHAEIDPSTGLWPRNPKCLARAASGYSVFSWSSFLVSTCSFGGGGQNVCSAALAGLFHSETASDLCSPSALLTSSVI